MLPESLCLTKAQRLRKPAQFQLVYQSKQWGHSRLFSFNALAYGCEKSPAVLGVTVSKKVSKRAVDRNRIKRQVREFFRHHQNDLQQAHVVITAKPACRQASDDQRLQSLEELWVKILSWQRWHKRQLKREAESEKLGQE